MLHKTLEAYSIPIPPQLAGLLKRSLGRSGTGFDEGAFLQQLHYWTLNPETTGWKIDGVKWIYNSLKSWRNQFPWMSEYGLRKAIGNLKKLGLIHTAQHWITSYRRVMFYRIDYERLTAFAATVRDDITTRCVNSDQVEVQDDHTTDTDTSSNTSLEQQTIVVSKEENESDKNTQGIHNQKMPDCDQVAEIPASNSADNLPPASSGNQLAVQDLKFPELIDAVAQAIDARSDSPLPTALKKAIAQFPERVQPAIAYLQHQQQKRQIQNPVGYLYEAIVSGWNLSIPEPDGVALAAGFSEWFNWAKATGLVVAATTIDGVHHTLHTEQGWLPTVQMMQEYPIPSI